MAVVGRALLMALCFSLAPFVTSAEEMASDLPRRATIQERFATKEGRIYLHGSGTHFVRNDFYQTWGYGLDIGYFPSESLGVELRGLNLHSTLSQAAEELRESARVVPDLRAPDALIQGGLRYSWGYGKIASMNRFVVHFDPQLAMHGGVVFAEERIAPILSGGLSFLSHFRFGIQVKLDLHMSLQFESRDRGFSPALGFQPILGFGWSPAHIFKEGVE